MSIKVGINGFGRIGRLVLRSICDRGLSDVIDVKAIADVSADAEGLAYALKHDSAHHKFRHDVATAKSRSGSGYDDILVIDGKAIRGLAAAGAPDANIIPSPTNAAVILGDVIPEVKGRLSGLSYRAPTLDVSVVDFSVRTVRETSAGELDALMKKASETYLAGYLGYTQEELVSSDFVHDGRSAVYDSPATLRSNIPGEGRLFRLVLWYDNEWGYSNRVVDFLQYIHGGTRGRLEAGKGEGRAALIRCAEALSS
jgi:glyceraldehyde-3-phosphate dehydrogenase/erythrose-4-phosphate dehydrogenase